MNPVFIKLTSYILEDDEPENDWDSPEHEAQTQIYVTMYKGEENANNVDGWEMVGIDTFGIIRYYICSGYGIKRTSNSRSIWKTK